MITQLKSNTCIVRGPRSQLILRIHGIELFYVTYLSVNSVIMYLKVNLIFKFDNFKVNLILSLTIWSRYLPYIQAWTRYIQDKRV